MKNLLTTVALACATALSAQTTKKPTFYKVNLGDQSIVANISDNGEWLLAQPGSNETCANANVWLINVATGAKQAIYDKTNDLDAEDAIGLYHVGDVTNDGNIVVGAISGTFSEDAGEYTGTPAYWVASEMTWHTLEMPDAAFTKALTGSDTLTVSYGFASSVTPDGKYASGSVTYKGSSAYSAPSYGVLWDLATGKLISLKGTPQMTIESNCHFETYMSMSADARYIVIYGDQSVQPTGFIYDRQNGTYVKFGKGVTNFLQLDSEPIVSPNGKYAAASIRTQDDEVFPVLYDIEAGEYTYISSSSEENDLMVCGVDNDGNVLAASPTSSPSREFQVLHNKIWYPFTTLCQLRYGIDFSTYTEYENTGTPYNMSTNGSVIASMSYPFADSYVVTLPESLSEACDGVNLLSAYTVSPAEGTEFAAISSVTFTFDYDITVLGAKTCAQILDKDGNVVRNSIGCAVSSLNSKSVVVNFRGTSMNNGEEYKVVIPAGAIAITNDQTKTNNLIEVSYKGRTSGPVTVKNIYPAEGSDVARLDNGSVYTILTMDTKITVSSDAKATLYQVDGDKLTSISTLNVVANDTLVALYPSSTQYLYAGAKYRIVLSAGSLTNAAGEKSSANEELVINYNGTYERQVSSDDATIFSEDFSNISNALNNLMRYEGDHLTPTSSMQNWEFDTDNQPWNFSIRESSSSSDYCAASHSMYEPAGQSDDWMVTPQLTIPDNSCYLSFDAQSYGNEKDYEDILKVVIWTSEENINALDSATVAKMKTEGDIREFTLTMGQGAETLSGDWTHYNFDLSAYAGKKIYIGFWNNNEDQSAMFVDNILVVRNLKYLLSLSNAQSVVDQKDITIAGSVTINADEVTYSSIALTLQDAEGKAISTVSQSDVALKKGDKFSFVFPDPLPLTVGVSNSFSINVQLDDYTDATKSSIKNLAFAPTKRVVLEEFTGNTCQNCPMGILGIENLEKLFGENFIPISIHAYTGDQLGGSISSSYASALGLNAAPSGIVQRCGVISSPMTQGDDGLYTFSYPDAPLWEDYVRAELEIPADIDVAVDELTYDESTNKLNLKVAAKSAINLTNQYLSTLVVILEDNIRSYQVNNCYNMTESIFGEFGKGGLYGVATASGVYHNDVVKAVVGSSFSGQTGLGFPSSMKAGEESTIDISFAYPDQVSKSKNGKVVVMLFDGNTEALVNSVVAKFPTNCPGYNDADDSDAIDEITADKVANTDVYSLAGILLFRNATAEQISSLPRGLYVVGGKLFSVNN